MNVVEAPKSRFIIRERILEAKEERTITKSKMFPLSLKYLFGPKAMFFSNASNANISAKL